MLVPGGSNKQGEGLGSVQAACVPGLGEPRCKRGEAWEEATAVSMALGTDPALWACFDLGNSWSLSACDLLLGCPVYTPGKAEEGIWLGQMDALGCKAQLCFECGKQCVNMRCFGKSGLCHLQLGNQKSWELLRASPLCVCKMGVWCLPAAWRHVLNASNCLHSEWRATALRSLEKLRRT